MRVIIIIIFLLLLLLLFRKDVFYEQFTISINGEPTLHIKGDVMLSSAIKDNTNNMFFSTILLKVYNNVKRYDDIEDRPIDVFYRSSNCAEDREKLVSIIRKTVEDAGFNFVVGGHCGGKGYPRESGDSDFYSQYAECEKCKEAKLILSIDNYNHDYTYLSEKFFLPLVYGAIPIYSGNGDNILQNVLNINNNCYLTRKNYSSDQDFANAIVELLKNKDKMKNMQIVDHFTSSQGLDRINFWIDGPKKVGYSGAPELIDYLRKTYPELYDKDEIRWDVDYHHLNDNVNYLGELLTLTFNKPSKKVDKNKDVLFEFCC